MRNPLFPRPKHNALRFLNGDCLDYSDKKMKFITLAPLLPLIDDSLTKNKACRFKPLPFGAAAMLTLGMRRHFVRPIVLITETPHLMDEMMRNLEIFSEPENTPLLNFPPLENSCRDNMDETDAIREGQRLKVLASLSPRHAPQSRQEPFLINTCIQALMQRILPPSALAAKSLPLSVNSEHDPDEIIARLEKFSYDFAGEVQTPGQATRRGGLIDVWPPNEAYPLRIEFDGALIESIRSFDPVDQRSFARKENLILMPASETADSQIENSSASLAKYLPPATIFFWVEKLFSQPVKGSQNFSGFGYHADLFEKEAEDEGRSGQIVPFHDLTAIISEKKCRQCFSTLLPSSATDSSLTDMGFEIVGNTGVTEYGSSGVNSETPTRRHTDTKMPQHSGTFQDVRRLRLAQLAAMAQAGMKIHLFFDTQGAMERFRNSCGDIPFKLHLGAVSDSFAHKKLNFAVVSESNFLRIKSAGRRPENRSLARKLSRNRPFPEKTGRTQADGITDWTNLEPGDLVVHANHGIGKYLGLHEIAFNGKLQEVFAVEYAGRAKLYVPVPQANLLSRYFTAGAARARIHSLGGNQWKREKLSAERAIYELAFSLIETQALRETLPGFAYPRDVPWQHDFEAAFPYDETEDQEKTIAEVKADMHSPTPMDRLICGDAGYGKTEVAMRAAFKTVMAGKQVAVLVPTTVLALQHFEVFRERMADYPVMIELLCRIRSAAEQQAVTENMKKGGVDIVIGTHRLLQTDVAFKDLGLIIIDEEQRFGVTHKEHLKHLRNLADVLTLTATPIPRTLYLSLTGARKISMIQTPPRDRLSVETIIAKNDDRLVRDAILRELNRGGQVFYLHNRIATIEKILLWLQKTVPEAKIAIAHGRMAASELAATMHDFAQGIFDVLLCTTIIESGVDLPNVNTIIIDRADRFGIADLYQLRGRVGRSDRKAYAYLLTPVHGYLLDISRRRLGAIVEHNQLGSGFKLAMLDLEIRGAGNLLGAEQSGHITAIGFDLYCQLLKRAIEHLKASGSRPAEAAPRQLRGRESPQTVCPQAPPRRDGTAALSFPINQEIELNLDFIDLSPKGKNPESAAFLPADYIEDEELRVKVYRKISAAASRDDLESLRSEFKDRFGILPQPFERFLKLAAIRILAAGEKISSVETRSGKLMLRRGNDYLQTSGKFPLLHAASADGRLDEIIRLLKHP